MIGNSAFEAPDACASAIEIARRALALLAEMKDVLPVLLPGLWQDRDMPNALREELRRARAWGDVHRGSKRRRSLATAPPASASRRGSRRPHAVWLYGGCAGAIGPGSSPGSSGPADVR